MFLKWSPPLPIGWFAAPWRKISGGKPFLQRKQITLRFKYGEVHCRIFDQSLMVDTIFYIWLHRGKTICSSAELTAAQGLAILPLG